MDRLVLTVSCPDRPGIVAAVSGVLAAHDALRDAFAVLAPDFALEWRLYDLDVRPKVLIMVSGQGHCLNDLLYRQRSGLLDIDIVAVASNHPDLRSLTQSYGVDYH